MSKREFHDMTDEIAAEIAAAAADPVAGPVLTQFRNELLDADRSYALGLAQLRKAFELTQAAMAQRLGTTQGNVAKIEHRDDILISTLKRLHRRAGWRGQDHRHVRRPRGRSRTRRAGGSFPLTTPCDR